MKNPFENLFKSPESQEKENADYTGETKFTTDATGSVVSEEMAASDKKFEGE